MAREWRRAVFAALAAAMLGGACVLSAQFDVRFGTLAHAANEEAEEEQDKAPAADAQPDPQPKGGKKRQDPAEAQRAIEAALKQVQAGRGEQAVQAMTATLSAGNLPPALMAKAFYVRGLAYRRQSRPAQAISDLNSALWLKGGLGSEDRVEATKERVAAYGDAGLGGRGGEPEAPGPDTAPKTGGSWLNGLFGSSPASGPPPAPARQPAPAKVEAAPPPRPPTAVSSGWSSKTEVQADRPSVAAAPPPPPRAAAPAPPQPRAAPPADPSLGGRLEGRYLVQLSPVRTEAEARALAAKAKREPALASRQAAIDQTVMGNMGSFYRVRFGPFATAQETQAVCAKLQGSGVDCLPVGP